MRPPQFQRKNRMAANPPSSYAQARRSMMTFRVNGIPDHLAEDVRQTMRAPGYGHPAHRELAQGTGPCRRCLRTFAVGGEGRILFTYQPFEEKSSPPAPGPILIHADGCEKYVGQTLPEDLRSIPLVFDAYANGGRLIAQERVGIAASDERLRELFARTSADYVHIRHGEA